MGDGVTYLDFGSALDSGNDVAHIAAGNLAGRLEFQFEDSDLICAVILSCTHELDLVSGTDRTVDDFEIGDHTSEGIEHGIEDQSLQRSVRIAFRTWDPVHDGIKDRCDSLSCPRRDAEDFLRSAAQKIADFVADHVRTGGVHVDLVQHGDDFQTVVYRKIEIGDSLCLNTLGGIHDQKSAFTGCNRTGHLIGEVNVPRSIDEIEDVLLAILVVLHLDRMALDGDPLFLLQVHIVQDLCLHVPAGQSLGQFEQPVGKSTLAMIYVSDYAEISDVFHTFKPGMQN